MKHQTSNFKLQTLVARVLAWADAPLCNRRGGRLAKWLVFHGQIT